MAITLEAIRAAGGIVHSDGNIFFRDISMLQGLAGAAPAAVAPRARDLLGIVRTAQAEARRLINGEDSGRDLAQTKFDLPETLRVLEHALSQPAAVAAPALEAPAAPAGFDAWWERAGDGRSKMMAKQAWDAALAAAPQAPRLGEDALHLLHRLLSNQHTLTGPEFRAELEKIVAEESARHAAAPQAPAAPSADERAAYVEFLAGKFPQTYSKEDAEHWWDHGHVSALIWQAARAVVAAPAAPAVDADPMAELLRDTGPAIVWPKARDVGRIGDMSPSAHLRIGLDSDNDVYASIWDERGGATIEFCTPGQGGGKSSRTRMALLAVMVAMEADNAADPGRDWWAERNAAAQAAAKGA